MPVDLGHKRNYMRQRYRSSRKLIRCPVCGEERFTSTLVHGIETVPCFSCSVKMEKGAREITSPEFAEIFWGTTIKTGTGCIEWVGSFRGDKLKYGRVNVNRKTQSTHRVAWMLANKASPLDGICVCHKCDNPICVNPEHLFLGTYADNERDKMAKGRKVVCAPLGEENGKHKLTTAEVIKIKNGIKEGLPNRWLGDIYKVNRMTIHAIRKGITWNNV